MYDKKIVDYDYLHNVFVNKPIKEQDLLDIYNKHVDIEGYQDRFEKRFTSTLKYVSRSTFWNSKMLEDIYKNMMDTLLNNNTLVINTNGNIVRKPSSIIICCSTKKAAIAIMTPTALEAGPKARTSSTTAIKPKHSRYM